MLGHVTSQIDEHLLEEDTYYLTSGKNENVQILSKPFVNDSTYNNFSWSISCCRQQPLSN